ncbi:hypothetical protein SAY86_015892 [Trapa natans]|uniref:non-specific serine/threonine protein kinase n=1 Tax=Trapa natans TaxID=22666 RepID=A0AAN7QZD3_TRANT|nr:hypothetical protein SAY86_015892 [Trapa natans]
MVDANNQLSGNKGIHRTLLNRKNVAVVVPGMLALCCVILCPCFYWKRKETTTVVLAKDPDSVGSLTTRKSKSATKKTPGSPLREKPNPRFSSPPRLTKVGSIHINLDQVVKITRNFSPSMVIGEGEFGTVYKAQLEDGRFIAIKRANKEHFERVKALLSSEADLLAKIDHRCLVKLLGYLDEGSECLIMTEYISNGTLREHLDGIRNGILEFKNRLEIAIDVAHGLTYLHIYSEKQIIHRDVNSSNILLTDSMRAKVADFGFATLGTTSDSDKSHVSTKVKGTLGYIDPVYMKTLQLTTKSDVYSFGILLLEIITGRRPLEQNKSDHERVTLRWLFKKFDEGNVEELVDPMMKEVVDREILVRIFILAFQCAAPEWSERPDMKIVGEQLWAIRMDYLNTVK